MCMGFEHYVCLFTPCKQCPQSPEVGDGLLELELHKVVSCSVGSGDWTWVF